MKEFYFLILHDREDDPSEIQEQLSVRFGEQLRKVLFREFHTDGDSKFAEDAYMGRMPLTKENLALLRTYFDSPDRETQPRKVKLFVEAEFPETMNFLESSIEETS